MKIIVVLLAALVLSGCVAMDVSNLETAEPLHKGKMRIGVNSGLGLNLTNMVEMESEEMQLDDFPIAGISGIHLQYGLTEDMDLGARVWAGGSSSGFKAYLKKTFAQNEEEGTTMAFAPGFSYVRSETDGGSDSPDPDIKKDWFTAAEASVQIMMTKRWSKGVAGTIGGRVAIDYYDGDSAANQNENNVEFLVHSGLSANVKFTMGPFYLIPEIGGEFYRNANGYTGVVPFFMVGLGFE